MIYTSLKHFFKWKKKMFNQKKIQHFTCQNYHWLIAIFLFLLIQHSTTMSYTEITNIYIKIGLVFVYAIIGWAYLTLVYFMYYSSINNVEKVTPVINSTSSSTHNEFNFEVLNQ